MQAKNKNLSIYEYSSEILIEGNITVRRQTFWSYRYGKVDSVKGLIYAKSKESFVDPKIIPLAGKKLMKGKRLNGVEYLAICTRTGAGDSIDIKLSFSSRDELEKWGKVFASWITGSDEKPISSPAKSSKPIVNSVRIAPKASASTAIRPTVNFVDEARGDSDPVENTDLAATPRILRNQPRVPGYISKFSNSLSAEEMNEIEKANDEFVNRTKWNIDTSGSASLLYTSKTFKQQQEERNGAPKIQNQEDDEEPFYLRESYRPHLLFVGVASVFLLSYILPSFLSFLLMAAVLGAFIYVEVKEKDNTDDQPAVVKPKSYKIKLMTNVVGLPDDIAIALSDNEKRKNWDIYTTVLNESTSKFIYYRKSASCCQILETRNPGKISERINFIEINKIRGKPYFLRLTIYTIVTPLMSEKVGREAAKNNLDSLRNYVLLEDSISEFNISLSNIQNNPNSIGGNTTLTITDMLGEIEELDTGADAFSETDFGEEESKVKIVDPEERKVPIESTPPPVKELTPEEKFEQELSKCPPEEQPLIKKARKKIEDFLEIVDDPNWKQIDKKGNNTTFSMEAPGGLKCIKGEGIIDFPASDILSYLERDRVSGQYDEQWVDGFTVQELSMNTTFECNKFKGIWPVSGRDFCILSQSIKQDDGKIIISAFSEENKDCPPDKKYVRAELIRGGWILTPDESDPDKTFAQYITQTDLKGNIPKSLVNTVSKKQGLLVTKVNEAMKKYF